MLGVMLPKECKDIDQSLSFRKGIGEWQGLPEKLVLHGVHHHNTMTTIKPTHQSVPEVPWPLTQAHRHLNIGIYIPQLCPRMHTRQRHLPVMAHARIRPGDPIHHTPRYNLVQCPPISRIAQLFHHRPFERQVSQRTVCHRVHDLQWSFTHQ